MTGIPAAILKQHIAILGKTGSGKTSTEKLIIEKVVAEGARVCILDTVKSDHWGLTSSANGKKPGLPFKILGGPRGHVPLHSNAGKVIGQLVASGKLPLSIVDMADFEAGGIQRFFCDFAQALFRHMRGVIYLVIEEAHEVAPKERAGFGAENMAIHWAKKLATGGRSKGIRLIVATQRVQALHNAVLGSCETVIAHRLTTPADRKPIFDWLTANINDKGEAAGIASSLGGLPTGTCWICSGEAQIFEKVALPKFHTFDNSKTPEGDEASVDIATAAVDHEELRTLIGDAVKEAEADDPKVLRARIASLEREVKQGISAQATLEIEQAERRGFEHGRNSALLEIQPKTEAVKEAYNNLAAEVAQMSKTIGYLETLPAASQWTPAQVAHFKSISKPAVVKAQTPLDGYRPGTPTGKTDLPEGELRVLTAIAQHNQSGLTREQITAFTGYKRSTRNTYISRLMAKGYLYERGDKLHVNGEGAAALPSNYERLPTGGDLRDFWLNKLPEGESAILKYLIAIYPRGVERDILDDACSFKKSTRNTYLSRLASKMLIDVNGIEVAASENLFT